MRRTLLISLGCLIVFSAAMAAGYAVTTQLWPDRIRQETERRLSRALKSPVRIGSARLVLGLGLNLIAEDISLYPGPDGAAMLRIDRASAIVNPLSLLRGQFRVRRLLLVGASLRVERDAQGRWSTGFRPGGPSQVRPPPHPDEILSPLIALETSVRRLLTTPKFSSAIELRDSRLILVDNGPGYGKNPIALSLENIEAHLRQGAFLGDTRLTARGRLFDANGERGQLEWEGRRSRGGKIRLAVATTALEMTAVGSYLKALYPRARVAGVMSGALVFETPEPGHGRLELDIVVRNLEMMLRPEEATAYGPVSARHAEAQLVLAISPQAVELERARIASGDLELEVSGTVDRPVRPGSIARLSLAFHNVDFSEARNLLGWLPEAERNTLASVVEPVEAGSLIRFEARGTSTLAGWEDFITGRTLHLPLGFKGHLEVAGGSIRVGESDRIEQLRGRASWQGDRIQVKDVQATLDGKFLPGLELTLNGVSNLFAAEASRRELVSDAVPILGLGALWETFRPKRKNPNAPARTALQITFDHLEHPMFLAPIEDLRATIVREERGVHIVVSEGTWAGVPIHAEADWIFEPVEKVHFQVTAQPPGPRIEKVRRRRGWAAGEISLGALRSDRWKQTGARGRFTARGGDILLHDVEIDLEPAGKMTGSITLDMTEADAVPFESSFELVRGDVTSVMNQLGLNGDLATGKVDLAGSLRGFFQPGVPVLNDLEGLLSVRADSGIINRGIPPVLAIAMANEAFNPFARRDTVRYTNLDTLLEFANGSLKTQSFAIDGPDLRVFAHGTMETARPPNEIDVEVAIFLFRQLDRAIEKIPLLNLLLLGEDENLQAAWYKLSGPWDEPKATPMRLRSLAASPATNVLLGVPRFLMKSIEAIESMLGSGKNESPESIYLERTERHPRAS